MTETKSTLAEYQVRFLNANKEQKGGSNKAAVVRKLHIAISASLTSRSYPQCNPEVTLSVIKKAIKDHKIVTIESTLVNGEKSELRHIVSISADDLVAKLEKHLEVFAKIVKLDDANTSKLVMADGSDRPTSESTGKGRKAAVINFDDLFSE